MRSSATTLPAVTADELDPDGTMSTMAVRPEPTLTRADVVAYLAAVDHHLERGSSHELVVVGGAYLALLGLRPASDDVDSAETLTAGVVDAARRVAQARGADKVWLNDRARAFAPQGLRRSYQVLLDLPRLRVLGPAPEVVFAMKLNASRPHDLADLVLLWPLCSFTGAEAAAATFEGCYPDEPVDEYLADHIARVVGLPR